MENEEKWIALWKERKMLEPSEKKGELSFRAFGCCLDSSAVATVDTTKKSVRY